MYYVHYCSMLNLSALFQLPQLPTAVQIFIYSQCSCTPCGFWYMQEQHLFHQNSEKKNVAYTFHFHSTAINCTEEFFSEYIAHHLDLIENENCFFNKYN